MPLGNLTADCEPDTCPIIFKTTVQALENGEDPVEILLVKTDAVVFHHNLTTIPEHFATDLHQGRRLGAVEFQSIVYQILQQLTFLRRVSVNSW
jgi:hypothetical protein